MGHLATSQPCRDLGDLDIVVVRGIVEHGPSRQCLGEQVRVIPVIYTDEWLEQGNTAWL